MIVTGRYISQFSPYGHTRRVQNQLHKNLKQNCAEA